MRQLNEYLSTKVKPSIIKATNETIRKIVKDELKRLGMGADLNHIDVSECSELKEIFHNLTSDGESFHGDVSKWNVENVTDMYYLFAYCYDFNCDLSGWDVHNVRNMRNLFYNCVRFEGKGLENWKTDSLEIAGSIFCGCDEFNGNVENWNTEKMTNASYMFAHCKKFNRDLSKWNVEKIRQANNMFYECKKIKFSFDDWYLHDCQNAEGMFGDSDIYANMKDFYIPSNCEIHNMFLNCEKLRKNSSFWPREINAKIAKGYPAWKFFG